MALQFRSLTLWQRCLVPNSQVKDRQYREFNSIKALERGLKIARVSLDIRRIDKMCL